MSLSKEIFGIEHLGHCISCDEGGSCTCGADDYNDALDIIDQFQLSEEELEILLNRILIGDFKSDERYVGTEACKHISQAIIQNKSKIFVRKNEKTS